MYVQARATALRACPQARAAATASQPGAKTARGVVQMRQIDVSKPAPRLVTEGPKYTTEDSGVGRRSRTTTECHLAPYNSALEPPVARPGPDFKYSIRSV